MELTAADIAMLLPKRDENAHKGNFGRILLLCGSLGYTGAAYFAAMGALRTGAGLVYLGVPESIYAIEAEKLNEPVIFPLPDQGGRLDRSAIPEILERLPRMDAVLIGPGLGLGTGPEAVLTAVLTHAACPVVIDADGITLLVRHMDILRGRMAPTVLTPHDGEFARLFGPVGEDRMASARAAARDSRSIVLLKGHRTCITDGTRDYRNTLCLLTLVDLFLRYGRYVYALSGSLFFKMGNDLVGLGIMTFHSKPTRRLLKEEEAENYNNQANATADNEHGAPAEHGQNDHVHSGGNQSTAVSDQANVGLVLTALRGRSELGEGGVACGERSAKAQTHEEAAAGQERCIGGACSDEAECGENRTADENRLLTADAVGKSACHEATKEVTNHGNGVEEGELIESHPTLGLKNVTDRAAYCHVNRVAERNASEQPQNLLVEASDGHTIQASCDAMVRRIQSIRSH